MQLPRKLVAEVETTRHAGCGVAAVAASWDGRDVPGPAGSSQSVGGWSVLAALTGADDQGAIMQLLVA